MKSKTPESEANDKGNPCIDYFDLLALGTQQMQGEAKKLKSVALWKRDREEIEVTEEISVFFISLVRLFDL